VFKWGNRGNKFYVILAGTVAVKIPNPAIPEFSRKFNEYQDFLLVTKWDNELKELERQFCERKCRLEIEIKDQVSSHSSFDITSEESPNKS
jgi:hypothetical protein